MLKWGSCIVALIFCACAAPHKQADASELIACESEFVMEDGAQATGYYQDRADFIKPYVQQHYAGDTLRVETLHEINSCGETVGAIAWSNDTLYLSAKLVGDEVCTSVEFHRFVYTIVKQDVERYVIVF